MTLYLSVFLTLLTLAVGAPFAEDAAAGTELIMTFLVHRHGDRTPVKDTISYSTDPVALTQLSAPYGYGELTDVGKRTAYGVGEFIRERYGDLLSARFNSSEIYIRSTDYTRTKMTVLTAMAAVFPTGDDNWSDTLPWQPTPYTTVPESYDYNLASSNCPTFENFYLATYMGASSKMLRFDDVLEPWSVALGFNVTQRPVVSYAIYDVYTSQMSLGLPLGDDLEELFPGIEAAAGEAIDILLGNDDYIALQAGVLLNEFLSAAGAAAAGNDTQRVRVYSAHDFNVYSFTAVTRVKPRQGVPKYGSVFALELRRRADTGAYAVLPVYVSSPGATPLYLQVEGCSELLCDLDEFSTLTADYALDETQWRDQCGSTDDSSTA